MKGAQFNDGYGEILQIIERAPTNYWSALFN